MAYSEIAEAVMDLSENSANEVLDFIEFLKAKEKREKKKKERKANLLAGGLVFMSDDFDETPDDFKEYM